MQLTQADIMHYQYNQRKQYPTSQSQIVYSNNYQNQNKIQRKDKHQKEGFIKQYYGLPNLRNICFLNSVIQCLFSLKDFRKAVINYKNSSFIKKLGAVFKSLQEFFDSHAKRQVLNSFIKELTKQHINYQGFSQQDSIDFLMLILNKLIEEDKDFSQYFKIVWIQHCPKQNCTKKRKEKFNQMYISSADQKCTECFTILQKNVLKSSKYLLIIGKDKGRHLEFINAEKQLIQYEQRAKVLYSGNGNFGHYVSERRLFYKRKNEQLFDNQWRIYNDSSIQKTNQYYTTKCSFYQMVQSFEKDKKPKQDIKREDTFQIQTQTCKNQRQKEEFNASPLKGNLYLKKKNQFQRFNLNKNDYSKKGMQKQRLNSFDSQAVVKIINDSKKDQNNFEQSSQILKNQTFNLAQLAITVPAEEQPQRNSEIKSQKSQHIQIKQQKTYKIKDQSIFKRLFYFKKQYSQKLIISDHSDHQSNPTQVQLAGLKPSFQQQIKSYIYNFYMKMKNQQPK